VGGRDAGDVIPDAHGGPNKKPTMLTTDLSLRFDPAYEKISRRFLENPQAFAEAFARAWFKLTHRDMGPCPLPGPRSAEGRADLAGPIPAVKHPLVNDADIAALKAKLLASGLSVRSWWHGLGLGLDLPRLGQARRRQRRPHPPGPQKDWAANNPRTGQGAGQARGNPARVQQGRDGDKRISLADLIVLAGSAASKRRPQTPA
jgi:catalase-peroxidase